MRTYDKMRQSVMEPRFIWLLEEMCRNCGVDVQLIDLRLSYSENKDNIQRITGIKLRLKKDFKEMDEEELKEWESQEEWYNAQVGVKKGRKKNKKVPVDIGKIVRACGGNGN